MPLYLTEADVDSLLSPAEAIEAVEASLARLARGEIDNRTRERLPLPDGELAVMPPGDARRDRLRPTGGRARRRTARGAAVAPPRDRVLPRPRPARALLQRARLRP